MFPGYDTRESTRYRRDGHREARENLKHAQRRGRRRAGVRGYLATARIDAPAHDRSYPMIR